MVPQPVMGRRAERIAADGVPIGWKVGVDRLDILDGAREDAIGAGAEACRAAARWAPRSAEVRIMNEDLEVVADEI